MHRFLNPLDAHFNPNLNNSAADEEYKQFDFLAVDKRFKHAYWLSQLVIEKIDKTIRDVEEAQAKWEL